MLASSEFAEFLRRLADEIDGNRAFHGRVRLNLPRDQRRLDLACGDGRSMTDHGNMVNTRLRLDLFFSKTAMDDRLVSLMSEFSEEEV